MTGLRSPAQQLRSAKRFASAAVSIGKMQVEDAMREYEETGHSCYGEGWAKGYLAAAQIIHKFLADLEAEQ